MPRSRDYSTEHSSPSRSNKLSMRQLQDFVYKTKSHKSKLPDAPIDESVVHMTGDNTNPLVTADNLTIGDIVYDDKSSHKWQVKEIIIGGIYHRDIVFIDLETNREITKQCGNLSLFEVAVDGDVAYEVDDTPDSTLQNKMYEGSKMKVIKLVESPNSERTDALNEGPFDIFKRKKGMDKADTKELRAAEKIMKQEDTLVGKRWSYYVNGKKVNHNDYIKLDDVTKQNAVVVDENGYFVRRGTEVLQGQKKVASVDVASGELTGDSAKVSASHQGTGNASGSPDSWSYIYNDEKITLPDYEALEDAEKAKVMVVDSKGKEIDQATAKAVIDRYNSRSAEKSHKAAVKNANRDTAKSVKRVNAKNGTTLTFKNADGSIEYSIKEFKKLSTAERKKLTAVYQSGDQVKEYTYDQLKKIPQLAKGLKLESLSESVSRRYEHADDDVMTESYTLSKSGVDYDDDFDASTFDAKYDTSYNIDDDFG